MLEELKVRGGNHYKQPHMRKIRLDGLGELPSHFEVPSKLIDLTHQFLCHSVINLNVLPPDKD